MKKHRFIFVRLDEMPKLSDRPSLEVPVYKCVHCKTERHGQDYEFVATERSLAKCPKSPVRAGWIELLKDKVNCAYDAKDKE